MTAASSQARPDPDDELEDRPDLASTQDVRGNFHSLTQDELDQLTEAQLHDLRLNPPTPKRPETNARDKGGDERGLSRLHVGTMDGPEAPDFGPSSKQNQAAGNPRGPPTVEPGEPVESVDDGEDEPSGGTVETITNIREDMGPYLELLERLAERDELTHGDVDAIKQTGTTFDTFGCADHYQDSEDGRSVVPRKSGVRPWDPLEAIHDARADRARPLFETLEQVNEATAHPLAVAPCEFTVPESGQDQIDPLSRQDVKRFRSIVTETLRWVWAELLELPGTPATYTHIHPTSSESPHELQPHAHSQLLGVARLDTPDLVANAEADPDHPAHGLQPDDLALGCRRDYDRLDTLAMQLEAYHDLPTGSVTWREKHGRDGSVQQTLEHETVPVFYILPPKSRFWLEDDQTAELYETWGRALEEEFGIAPAHLTDHREDLRMHIEGAVAHWSYRSMDPEDDEHGKAQLRHRCRYDTRAYLEDVLSQVRDVDGITVTLEPTEDSNGPRNVRVNDLLEGLLTRLNTPEKFQLGAWAGPLADCVKRRAFNELELEYETKEERRERLAEEARTCGVEGCEQELGYIGPMAPQEAQSYERDGTLPQNHDPPPTQRIPDDYDGPRGRVLHDDLAPLDQARPESALEPPTHEAEHP